MIYGPDAAFGLMSAAMTPGDLGDKLIAGGSTAIGGSLGGVAGRSTCITAKARIALHG